MKYWVVRIHNPVEQAIMKEWTMIRSVEVELIKGGGQARPYAPHIWEAYLTFKVPEGQMWASKFGHGNEDVVKPYVTLFVHSFYEGTDKGIDAYYSAKLEKLEEMEPGKWHVIITEPYID